MNSYNQEVSPAKDFKKIFLWIVITLPVLYLLGHIAYVIHSFEAVLNANTNIGQDKAYIIIINAAMVIVPFLFAYLINVFMYARKHKKPEQAIIDNAYIFSLKFALISAVINLITSSTMAYVMLTMFSEPKIDYMPEFIFSTLMASGIVVIISTIVAYIVAIIYSTIAKVIYLALFGRNKK